MILPNLIIAGVNKAGTTSLYSYLSMHPDVSTSDVKETCFFLPLRYGEQLPSIDSYADHFSGAQGAKYVMESTPGYFYGGQSMAEHIEKTLPNVKIVLMLRDPVDRLISFYRFKKSMLELESSIDFEEYLNRCISMDAREVELRENNKWYGVAGGLYERHIEAWFNVFGDRIKVVFFDDLKSDAVTLVKGICTWLAIDEGFYDGEELSVENMTMQFKNRKIQQVALWLNENGERYFRKNPNVKQILRSAYQRINSSNTKEHIDQEQKNQAQQYFESANQKLLVILSRHGYKDLPQWLTHTRPSGNGV